MVNLVSCKDDEGLGKDQYNAQDITSEAIGGLDSFWTYTSVYIGFAMKLPVIKMQPCSVSATVSHEYGFQNLRKSHAQRCFSLKFKRFYFSPSQ